MRPAGFESNLLCERTLARVSVGVGVRIQTSSDGIAQYLLTFIPVDQHATRLGLGSGFDFGSRFSLGSVCGIEGKL